VSVENHKIHINSADKAWRVCVKCEFIYVYKVKDKVIHTQVWKSP